MRAPSARIAVQILLLAITLNCALLGYAQDPIPHSSHVVLLMDENISYSTTLAEMPWLVSRVGEWAHDELRVQYYWLVDGLPLGCFRELP
jgi:hypothetical protein